MGCGGGAPLLHPAHTLFPGDVTLGAGLTGQVALRSTAPTDASPTSSEASRTASLETLSVAPGVAPWVGGRVGITGDNEAGLTYSGRAIRIDGRHAWNLGAPTLSVGLGATAILAQRPGQDPDRGSVYGGGLDLPVLIGVKSKNDLYALWFGPRGGFETMSGELAAPPDPAVTGPAFDDVSAQHYYVGLVLGLRAGFRHIHVAIELDGAFHYATGTLGTEELSLSQVTLAPGGALVISF
jgi:hypothetical protein